MEYIPILIDYILKNKKWFLLTFLRNTKWEKQNAENRMIFFYNRTKTGTLYLCANIIKSTHALNYMHMGKICLLGHRWRNYIKII